MYAGIGSGRVAGDDEPRKKRRLSRGATRGLPSTPLGPGKPALYGLYGFFAAARIWLITGIFSSGGGALLKLRM